MTDTKKPSVPEASKSPTSEPKADAPAAATKRKDPEFVKCHCINHSLLPVGEPVVKWGIPFRVEKTGGKLEADVPFWAVAGGIAAGRFKPVKMSDDKALDIYWAQQYLGQFGSRAPAGMTSEAMQAELMLASKGKTQLSAR